MRQQYILYRMWGLEEPVSQNRGYVYISNLLTVRLWLCMSCCYFCVVGTIKWHIQAGSRTADSCWWRAVEYDCMCCNRENDHGLDYHFPTSLSLQCGAEHSVHLRMLHSGKDLGILSAAFPAPSIGTFMMGMVRIIVSVACLDQGPMWRYCHDICYKHDYTSHILPYL